MILYIDGGCMGNNQKDLSKREMVTAVTKETGEVVLSGRYPGGSNNIAELCALVDALDWYCEQNLSPEPLELRTDSRNNLAWAQGGKVGRGVNDRTAVLNLQAEIRAIGVAFTLVWVPRDENLAGHILEKRYGL